MNTNNNLDLSLLWHDASEEPKDYDKKILVADAFGNFWVCEVTDYQYIEYWSWEDYVNCYQVSYWANIKDLFPEELKTLY